MKLSTDWSYAIGYGSKGDVTWSRSAEVFDSVDKLKKVFPGYLLYCIPDSLDYSTFCWLRPALSGIVLSIDVCTNPKETDYCVICPEDVVTEALKLVKEFIRKAGKIQ